MRIQQDGFFEAVVSSVNDWDEALDKRDKGDLGSVWASAFERLKSREYSSASDEKAVNDIREYVFKRIYALTHNSDAAGYISDDIGLAAESISKSFDNEWVEELLGLYCSGVFPD
ncbi:hypothetical protein TZ03_27270 [Pseudomonas sp. 10-1B]|nr:hypothetical protein TZ03_27270 [Pseudomonas sp. 10-1B]